MLEASFCRTRQQRLLRAMYAKNISAVVLGWRSHVYYFTGHWPFWQHQAAFVLFSNGKSALVCAREPDRSATADECITYDSTWMSTNRQEQSALAAEKVLELLVDRRARRIGIDAAGPTAPVAMSFEGEKVSVEAELFQLRRKKDSDELAIMRVAIECTKKMYERARQIIEPGIPELKVFSELHEVAVTTAGQPLSAYLGNDFACGERGGPPRNERTAKAGELYILDLGPAVKGYFSDNCRAIAVNRKPTDVQLNALNIVKGVFPIIESIAKPGAKCKEIFSTVNEYYRQKTGGEFPHHLGHGVGLSPHEFPHLNPRWDDVLEEGEIFTCEPGVYGDPLAQGIRIENQYRVTADGVENLTPFPMELA